MIQLKSLTFGYTNNYNVINDITLDLYSGKIYGLLGKNGVGKTTLMKLMCGLLFPKSGSIELNGNNPALRKPSSLSNLFYLPEEIHLPAKNPRQLIDLYAPFYPNFNEIQFFNFLTELDVDHHKNLKKLSFGQKKKALIAFALACNTQYIFLDEPTNGLDIPSKISFRSIISRAYDENKVFVISTHQVRDLDSLIDTVLIMNENKVIFNETIERIGEVLKFRSGSVAPENALFSHNDVMGISYLMKNENNIQEKINIETLFNSVIAKPEQIIPLFKK